MRNLKKFLALVLAMLMVSACAVSVSAAFADQSAVNAHDYADAIEELYDLGVIAGKEDANGNVAFDPEGTLTREEAAVVAAKLIAGSKQTFDWTAATTCRFTDVTAKWSFGYIEFAADRGVLDGIGDGKYNPKGTLDVASAVAIVVKALGLRNEVLALDAVAKPSVWYLNWIEVAEDNGLLTDVNPFSYTQTCTRAMMAQLASNALASNKGDNKLNNGFANQKLTVVGMLTAANADGVVVDGKTFNTEAFNAALDGLTASQLIDCKVEVKYNPKTNKITDVEVLTSTLAFNYKDGKLAVVVKDKKNTNQITLDGATYTVAATAGSNTSNNAGIGSGTSTTNSLTLTVDGATILDNGACKDLPAYYAGLAYDDNNDGIYDRVAVDTYEFATVEKIKWNGKLNNDDSKWVPIYGIKYLADGTTDDTYAKINNTAHALYETTLVNADLAVMDKETPVLVNVKKTGTGTQEKAGVAVISFLGSAEKVTGVLAGYSASSKYVTIGTTKYPYAPVSHVANPANWALNQTVVAFVYEGKYLGFAAESIASMTVIVDRVTIDANGNAVIVGFDVDNSYADVTVTVNGVLKDKILAMGAQQTYKVANDTTSGLNPVEIGRKENNTWKTYATLLEGGKYELVKTADGIYLDTAKLLDTTYAATTDWTLTEGWYNAGTVDQWNAYDTERVVAQVYKVDENYIYVDANDHWGEATPFYYNANHDATVIVVNAGTDAKDPYSQTYTLSKTIDNGTTKNTAFVYNVNFNLMLKNGEWVPGDNNNKPHDSGHYKNGLQHFDSTASNYCNYFDWNPSKRNGWMNTTVSLIVFTEGIKAQKAEQTALAENTGIAQIVDAFETAYDTTKYNAIDLLTGAEIELVSENSALEAKAFYEYNTTDNTVIGKTLWVGTFKVENSTTTSGLSSTSTLKAQAVKLVEQTAGEGDYKATQYGDAVTFKNVVVYKTVDGILSIKDGKIETLETKDIANGNNFCYIMGDTLIVIK